MGDPGIHESAGAGGPPPLPTPLPTPPPSPTAPPTGGLNRRLAGWNPVMLAVVAVVVAGAAMHAARVFFLPLTTGLLLAMLVWPLHRRMAARVPAWTSAGILVLGMVVLAAAPVTAIGLSGSLVVDRMASVREGISAFLESARGWFSEQGLPTKWIPAMSHDGGAGDACWASALRHVADFLTSGLGAAAGVLTVIALSIAFMGFALLEVPRWEKRIRRILGRGRAERTSRALASASAQCRRYLLAKTVSGVVGGLAAGLLCWVVGVPMAWVWALLTWAMNYIPNVGVFFSAIPPILLAFTMLGVWQGVTVAAGLVLIEGLTANVLAPLLEGNSLPVSPLTVMVALVFWGWMWGAAGAFLAVPIALVTLTLMRRTTRLKAAAAVLTDGMVARGRER